MRSVADAGEEMSTTAAIWFATEAEFRQLCSDARSLAKGEKSEEFTHQMMLKANEYGLRCFITAPQLKWLCEIADHEVPKPVRESARP